MYFHSMSRKILCICGISVLGSIMSLGTLSASKPKDARKELKSSKKSSQRLGFTLVNHFWEEVEEQDVNAYSELLAPHFQGINVDGIYTRSEQISGLEGLTVTSFTITNLIAARYCNTLVVSYDFTAEGDGVTSGPSIDIWEEKDHEWKLISHSYVPYQD